MVVQRAFGGYKLSHSNSMAPFIENGSKKKKNVIDVPVVQIQQGYSPEDKIKIFRLPKLKI